jgi:hypothetical protein
LHPGGAISLYGDTWNLNGQSCLEGREPSQWKLIGFLKAAPKDHIIDLFLFHSSAADRLVYNRGSQVNGGNVSKGPSEVSNSCSNPGYDIYIFHSHTLLLETLLTRIIHEK